MDNEQHEDLKLARAKLSMMRPYFSVALWAMKLVQVKGLMAKFGAAGPIGVDQYWRCYYDPDEMAKYSLMEKVTLLVHELGHLLRNHHLRSKVMGVGDENCLAANICQDWSINSDIVSDAKSGGTNNLEIPKAPEKKLILPSDPPFVYPLGLAWEEYYNKLPKKKIPAMKGTNCGSGAHGKKQPWDKEGEGRGKVSSREAELIRHEVAERIREEVDKKGRDSVPGGWQAWAETFLDPQIDWRRELPTLVRSAIHQVRGLVDYSYSKPNRRQVVRGDSIILPSMVAPTISVGVVLDSSGSMSQRDLGTAVAEVCGVLKSTGIRDNCVNYYCTDAAVHVAKKVRGISDIEIKGGGGTDMGVGIERALEDKPDVIIVMTDGYTPWPNEEPSAKIIALIIGEGDTPGPPYGKTLHIPPAKE